MLPNVRLIAAEVADDEVVEAGVNNSAGGGRAAAEGVGTTGVGGSFPHTCATPRKLSNWGLVPVDHPP